MPSGHELSVRRQRAPCADVARLRAFLAPVGNGVHRIAPAVSDELLDQRALSDATWSAVEASLHDRAGIETSLLIRHYQGLAPTIGAPGIQLEQGPRSEAT